MIWSGDTKSTGKSRGGPPFRGPPLHFPHPRCPRSTCYSYCSNCTSEVQLYVVYLIVFWYVKNDRRSPFSHLCLIFYFLFYAMDQDLSYTNLDFHKNRQSPFSHLCTIFNFYFPFLKTMSYNVLRETRHLLTYCRILLHLRQDPAPVRRTQWGWQSAPRAPVLKLPIP